MSMQPDWTKAGGLLPMVVQHARTGEVLMLGYVNEAAVKETEASGLVTFFSRSKQRLWTKGETSGNVLRLVDLHLDCDGDTFLARVEPVGPTCHQGTSSCFGAGIQPPLAFLAELDALVGRRHTERPADSYTTALFESGTRRIAQKVGEEGVEVALAGVVQDDRALLGEAADLVFHLTVLLRDRGLDLSAVAAVLAERHATSPR